MAVDSWEITIGSKLKPFFTFSGDPILQYEILELGKDFILVVDGFGRLSRFQDEAFENFTHEHIPI